MSTRNSLARTVAVAVILCIRMSDALTMHTQPIEETGTITINPDGSETETETFSMGPENINKDGSIETNEIITYAPPPPPPPRTPPPTAPVSPPTSPPTALPSLHRHHHVPPTHSPGPASHHPQDQRTPSATPVATIQQVSKVDGKGASTRHTNKESHHAAPNPHDQVQQLLTAPHSPSYTSPVGLIVLVVVASVVAMAGCGVAFLVVFQRLQDEGGGRVATEEEEAALAGMPNSDDEDDEDLV